MKEKRVARKIVYCAIAFLVGIIVIYPLTWTIMSLFKGNSTILSMAGGLTPENFILKNYSAGWKGSGRIPFAVFFKNSPFISIVTTAGTAVSSAPVVYGFIRFKFRDRGILFVAMLLPMMLPAQVFMIPQYLRYQKLGWAGSYLPLTIPYFFAIWDFFVYPISNFTSGIPIELGKVARVDGCSYAGVLGRIILPLIKPVPVAVCILSLMWRWDDFLPTLLYASKSGVYPVSLALKLFCDPGSSSDYGTMFAMATLFILLSILTLLFFQKYLVEGVSTSGLKG